MQKTNSWQGNEKDQFLDNLAKTARIRNRIKPNLYQQYNVKRGLRNADGTGVLVGLTEIGNVHGYILVDGEKSSAPGKLTYRGIDVAELARGCRKEKRHGFEETAYLLMFGQLPNRDELAKFNQLLAEKRRLPSGFTKSMILEAPSSSIMNKLARTVLACYSYDKNPEERTLKNILRQCINLIACFPTLAAYAYQAKAHYHDKKSLFIHSPDPDLSTAENLLRMTRSDKKFTAKEADLLDLALILHAEHGGGNNSTFTTHVVSSADTDTYSAIAAAIGSLKGLRHGGANIKAVKMMKNIQTHVNDWDDEDEIAKYLTKILKREAFDKTGLIYGLGHAVYTISDPRAVLLKARAKNLAEKTDRLREFMFYITVEKLAPQVFAKVKKSDKVISANVDFYSGFVYSMLGIAPELFTPIFAVARIAGWSAHLLEERVSGGRINRPACKNVISARKYVPLDER